MSRWWRAYDEAVDDPKLQRLPAEMFRAWFNLCCITSQNDGTLPDMASIAFKLRLSEAKTRALIEKFKALDLVDDLGDGRLAPHNWDGRQYRSDNNDPTNAERQKRYRNRHRNGESNGVTTVTVTDPETEADTEQNRTEKEDAAPLARPEVSDDETELFKRGKQILGGNAGGVIAKLLKAKGGRIPLARAAIEVAATKQDPREYIGAIVREGNDNKLFPPEIYGGLQ